MAVDAELAAELLALKGRDDEMRSRLVREGRLYDGYAEEMQQVHRENAQRLNELVEQHGWPGVSLVGLEGCRAAWLVAQHAICTPELQRKFHRLISTAVEQGDAPKPQLAYLTDRIRFNEGKPQLYGTVLDWNEQGELSCVVEDPANLDARRAEMGLPPSEEDWQRCRKAAEAEGGRAPPDMAKRKREQLEWAKKVGWS